MWTRFWNWLLGRQIVPVIHDRKLWISTDDCDPKVVWVNVLIDGHFAKERIPRHLIKDREQFMAFVAIAGSRMAKRIENYE